MHSHDADHLEVRTHRGVVPRHRLESGRIRSTGNDNPGGILGTRYKSNKDWGTYRNVEGFELYAGQDGRAGYNAFGANVSVPQKEKNMLKQLIESNIGTFTSGTFATLAGGPLLEMVKKLMC